MRKVSLIVPFHWQYALRFNYELNVVDKIGENAVDCYRALILSLFHDFMEVRIIWFKLIYDALLPSS
jgi:hypothetical protein